MLLHEDCGMEEESLDSSEGVDPVFLFSEADPSIKTFHFQEASISNQDCCNVDNNKEYQFSNINSRVCSI